MLAAAKHDIKLSTSFFFESSAGRLQAISNSADGLHILFLSTRYDTVIAKNNVSHRVLEDISIGIVRQADQQDLISIMMNGLHDI